MKLPKSKKAQAFTGGLVVITIIILSMALIGLEAKEQDLDPKKVGEKQLDIFKTHAQSENTLFYIDQAAKLSAEKAISDLADKGGFALAANCGVDPVSNYAVWVTSTKECYPDYELNFKVIFTQYLNQYLELLWQNLAPPRPPKFINNYELSLIQDKGLTIIGTPLQPIPSLVLTTEKTIVGTTKIYPSFNIKVDFNLDRFKQMRDDSAELIKKCKNEVDLEKCVVDNYPSAWELGICRGTAEVDTTTRIAPFCNPMPEGTYKFALQFP